MMTTGPAVMGTSYVRAHGNDPCRFLSTDFGLPVSSSGSGARVRTPNDDRPYLTSWREQTQERHRPRGKDCQVYCRLGRGLSPLAFCYLNAGPVPSRGPAMPTSDDTAASDPALLRIDGPIATITLNRPAAFNSINLSIAQKLEQLGSEVEGNDDIRVLVIEGEGRAFSAGGDLQTIGAAAANDTIAPVVGELLRHYHAFIETVRRMPKIVLSSVHGSAAGAGMGLAFVTDLCIAAEDARFTPAYAKIGVSPDGGSTVGMVGTVGTRRALQIFLAEDSFTAQQAYA